MRPYDLRHYFITRALQEGADIKALSEVVGSAPATLIKHYQHVSRKQHIETVGKMPNLNERTTRKTNNILQLKVSGNIKKK